MALLLNEECDPECNNEYCYGYNVGSSFEVPLFTSSDEGVGDLGQCSGDIFSLFNDTRAKEKCYNASRNSPFVDPNLSHDQSDICHSDWIGDGVSFNVQVFMKISLRKLCCVYRAMR